MLAYDCGFMSELRSSEAIHHTDTGKIYALILATYNELSAEIVVGHVGTGPEKLFWPSNLRSRHSTMHARNALFWLLRATTPK